MAHYCACLAVCALSLIAHAFLLQGCGGGSSATTTAPPSTTPHAPSGVCIPAFGVGTRLHQITVGSAKRSFLLKVPANVDVSAGLPAIVAMHGWSTNPYYQTLLAGLERFNNDQYFNESDPTKIGSFEYEETGYKWLIAVPFGTATTSSPLCCASNLTTKQCESGRHLDADNPCAWNAGSCCDTAPSRKVDDVAFVKALADYLVSSMCANSDALFATGFSNGAMMSNRVGCELAGTFRGIAPFDGPMQLGGDFVSCIPSRPVSVIQFCGTDDQVCSGQISSTMEVWRKANGCSSSTVDTFTSATSKCTQWTGCSAGTIVEQCLTVGLKHQYTGHIRPGRLYLPSSSDFGYQPATNIDGFRYIMNRFSTLLPDAAAKAVGLPTKAEQELALKRFQQPGAVV